MRLLRPAAGGHPWPSRLPASRFGQIPGDEIDYVQVAPELIVEIEADTAFEQGRWRHATRFVRVRHDLAASDLEVDSHRPHHDVAVIAVPNHVPRTERPRLASSPA